MTIRVPRVLIAMVVLGMAVGGGVALGYLMADDLHNENDDLHNENVGNAQRPDHERDRAAGGQVIQDLLERGDIGKAEPVEQAGGWASEFEVDRAAGVIRFREDSDGRVIQWECARTAEGRELDAAIREVSQARGFKRESALQ